MIFLKRNGDMVMSEWTDAKIRWAATKIQASIRGLLQRWRDLREHYRRGGQRLGLKEKKATGYLARIRWRARGDMQLRLVPQTPAQMNLTMQRNDRWKRRLRRHYGETVAEGVIDLWIRRTVNTMFRRIRWFDHRKRLGVKLLDFGS